MTKTFLEINFKNDLKQILLSQFKKAGYQFNKKDSLDQVVHNYFNIIFREIDTRPRKIHYSKELTAKNIGGKNQLALKNIVQLATSGGRLNSYLSMNLITPSYKDILLYDWRIHHLHLGTRPDSKKPSFIERTKMLLYARVEKDDFYLIDILDHDPINGFANKQLLEIICQNWPSLISNNKLVLAGAKNIVSNEDIHKIRKAGAITCITLSDGQVYTSSGGGYSSNGSSMEVTRSTDYELNHK